MNWPKMVKIAALMMGASAALVLAALVCVFPAPAQAREAPNPLDLIRNFTCVVPGYGVAPVLGKPTLNNLAVAERTPGDNKLVIWVRADLMELFKPATRLFWLEHECAHHRLGHTQYKGQPDNIEAARREDEADCAALSVLVDPNDPKIDGDGLNDIRSDVGGLPQAGFYPSGEERVLRMSSCVLRSGKY